MNIKSRLLARNVIFCFWALLQFNNSNASENRALIIGIDSYESTPETPEIYLSKRSGFKNLNGCVNDAISIKDVLLNNFHFKNENIKLLLNTEASRNNIISSIRSLEAICDSDDILVFYFAGHGSQLKNSLSFDGSGFDQTIVPSDLIDIRNKELNSLFSKLITKRVRLTLIFDSCHSGAITRNILTNNLIPVRSLPALEYDALDSTIPLKLEDYDALILSACQRDQLALETKDEIGNTHGAFTMAFLKAINSVNTFQSSLSIFKQTKAILINSGKCQEPVLAANKTRQSSNLIGTKQSPYNYPLFPTLKIDSDSSIVLQAGIADGLYPGSILVKDGDSSIQLKLTQNYLVNHSKATLITGNIENISSGDLFRCKKRGFAINSSLKFYVEPSTLVSENLNLVALKISAIELQNSFNIVTNPVEQIPDYVINYSTNSWKIVSLTSKEIHYIKDLSAEALANFIPPQSKVYFRLPLPPDLLKKLFSNEKTFLLSTSETEADYILSGTYNNQKIEYRWILNNFEAFNKRTFSPLPNYTEAVALSANSDLQLSELAEKITRINIWLSISPPPSESVFPFSLALKNESTGNNINGGEVYESEHYQFILVPDTDALLSGNFYRRYVYLFGIDNSGRSNLIFPPIEYGNELNHLPQKNYDLRSEIPLGNGNISITISPPFGIDNFILLTSDFAINDLTVFNQDGVVNRTVSVSYKDSLTGLLSNLLSGKRSQADDLEFSNWDIQKIHVRSRPAKQK